MKNIQKMIILCIFFVILSICYIENGIAGNFLENLFQSEEEQNESQKDNIQKQNKDTVDPQLLEYAKKIKKSESNVLELLNGIQKNNSGQNYYEIRKNFNKLMKKVGYLNKSFSRYEEKIQQANSETILQSKLQNIQKNILSFKIESIDSFTNWFNQNLILLDKSRLYIRFNTICQMDKVLVEHIFELSELYKNKLLKKKKIQILKKNYIQYRAQLITESKIFIKLLFDKIKSNKLTTSKLFKNEGSYDHEKVAPNFKQIYLNGKLVFDVSKQLNDINDKHSIWTLLQKKINYLAELSQYKEYYENIFKKIVTNEGSLIGWKDQVESVGTMTEDLLGEEQEILKYKSNTDCYNLNAFFQQSNNLLNMNTENVISNVEYLGKILKLREMMKLPLLIKISQSAFNDVIKKIRDINFNLTTLGSNKLQSKQIFERIRVVKQEINGLLLSRDCSQN